MILKNRKIKQYELTSICNFIFEEAEKKYDTFFYFCINGPEHSFEDEYNGYENMYVIEENRDYGTSTVGSIKFSENKTEIILSSVSDIKEEIIDLRIPVRLISNYIETIIAFLKAGYFSFMS